MENYILQKKNKAQSAEGNHPQQLSITQLLTVRKCYVRWASDTQGKITVKIMMKIDLNCIEHLFLVFSKHILNDEKAVPRKLY